MGTEQLTLNAVKTRLFSLCPRTLKESTCGITAPTEAFYQFNSENSTAGEKQIQCIQGGRGGKIYQDNFKSVNSLFPSFLWNNFSSGQI